jgi:hypothetical protein
MEEVLFPQTYDHSVKIIVTTGTVVDLLLPRVPLSGSDEKMISVRKLGDDGIALVTSLIFMLLFTVMGMTLIYSITSTVKASGLLIKDSQRYYGAEGGVLSVAAYMTFYKRTDAPRDITDSDTFIATTLYLGETVRYPVGYSTLWKGADVRINSKSPPTPNDIKEVEAVVFIPTTPVGYGNE